MTELLLQVAHAFLHTLQESHIEEPYHIEKPEYNHARNYSDTHRIPLNHPQMSAVEKTNGVTIIGATNQPQAIDTAVSTCSNCS